MKNFTRRNSDGHHGSKRRELAQHSHSRGSHAFTHTLYIYTVTTTWYEAPAQLLFFIASWVFSCFRNPPNSDIEYRIFNVRTWAFLCVRIHTGVGHISQHNILYSEKLTMFSCAPDGIRTLVLGILRPTLYQWSHPVSPNPHPPPPVTAWNCRASQQ